jgi:hypothetical protein
MRILQDIVVYSMSLVALAWVATNGEEIGKFLTASAGAYSQVLRAVMPRQ